MGAGMMTAKTGSWEKQKDLSASGISRELPYGFCV
jgi:hypothetical protein